MCPHAQESIEKADWTILTADEALSWTTRTLKFTSSTGREGEYTNKEPVRVHASSAVWSENLAHGVHRARLTVISDNREVLPDSCDVETQYRENVV